MTSNDTCLKKLLDRHISLKRQIASGSFGDISQACVKSDGSEVCNIVVKSTKLKTVQEKEKAKRETQIHTLLDNIKPQIVPKFVAHFICSKMEDTLLGDVRVKYYYLIMEKLDGDLSSYTLNYGLNSNHILSIFKKIHLMHMQHIVHLDLHGKNILYKLLPSQTVKFYITDFDNAYQIQTKKDVTPRRLNFMFGAPEMNIREAFYYDYYTLIYSLYEQYGIDITVDGIKTPGDSKTIDFYVMIHYKSGDVHRSQISATSARNVAIQAYKENSSIPIEKVHVMAIGFGSEIYTQPPSVIPPIRITRAMFDVDTMIDLEVSNI